MTENFWLGKRVLVTGHTGFKGSWLCLWLQKLGANVTGFSLEPPTKPSLFQQASVAQNMVSIIGDIRELEHLFTVFNSTQPEIVFHLAAQSIVRTSYKDPIETYSTNVMGSLNILEATKNTESVRALVMVSTDKCYENKESSAGYKEQDRLGGFDPYSSSKACLEILVDSYRQSYTMNESNNLSIATVRAGNVIGGGDYAKDRLIPDIVTVIENNDDLMLRYPNAIRPWQHVLEPLSGYLMLAEKLFLKGKSFAQAWNFGPKEANAQTVEWVSRYLIQCFQTNTSIKSNSDKQPHETSYLRLDASKAKEKLGWQSVWSIETTLQKIFEWQSNRSLTLHELCLKQILEYQHAIKQRK